MRNSKLISLVHMSRSNARELVCIKTNAKLQKQILIYATVHESRWFIDTCIADINMVQA